MGFKANDRRKHSLQVGRPNSEESQSSYHPGLEGWVLLVRTLQPGPSPVESDYLAHRRSSHISGELKGSPSPLSKTITVAFLELSSGLQVFATNSSVTTTRTLSPLRQPTYSPHLFLFQWKLPLSRADKGPCRGRSREGSGKGRGAGAGELISESWPSPVTR